MKIVIESIPHDQHRYPTVGDYWWDSHGTLHIRVSELPDRRMTEAIVLHELWEALLTKHRNIAEETIMDFDIASLSGPYADDPGHDPNAPYHREHVQAELIERQYLLELDVDWQDHDAAVRALEPQQLSPIDPLAEPGALR